MVNFFDKINKWIEKVRNPKKSTLDGVDESIFALITKAIDDDDPKLIEDFGGSETIQYLVALMKLLVIDVNHENKFKSECDAMGVIIPNRKNNMLLWLIKNEQIKRDDISWSRRVDAQTNARSDATRQSVQSLILSQADAFNKFGYHTFLDFLKERCESDKECVRTMLFCNRNGVEFLSDLFEDADKTEQSNAEDGVYFLFKLAPTKDSLENLLELGWITPMDVIAVHEKIKNNREEFFWQQECIGDGLLCVMPLVEAMILKKNINSDKKFAKSKSL